MCDLVVGDESYLWYEPVVYQRIQDQKSNK